GHPAAKWKSARRSRHQRQQLSGKRGIIRPGQRELERHRQPWHRTLLPYCDAAALRQRAGGGGYNGGYLSSAELYDPAVGTWTATGSLGVGRYFHSATLLPS